MHGLDMFVQVVSCVLFAFPSSPRWMFFALVVSHQAGKAGHWRGPPLSFLRLIWMVRCSSWACSPAHLWTGPFPWLPCKLIKIKQFDTSASHINHSWWMVQIIKSNFRVLLNWCHKVHSKTMHIVNYLFKVTTQFQAGSHSFQ